MIRIVKLEYSRKKYIEKNKKTQCLIKSNSKVEINKENRCKNRLKKNININGG